LDVVIACAGGYVTVGEELIYDMPMTGEEMELAVEKLHEEGVFCTIECKDGAFGDENLGEFLEKNAGEDGKGNSEIERWRKALASSLHIRPISEYDGTPAYKVVIMCLHPEQLVPAREALEDRYNFVVQEITDPAHKCINGELINRKYDKGRAILRVCDHLGVPVSDTYGFGDSMNDLEMIQTVGTSVCMANGAQALKDISDVVCPSVEEDGLAKAFEQLGLV
jgi:hydroxymethylpyrimidine pyrophosphatase-like HAD family hydrolase